MPPIVARIGVRTFSFFLIVLGTGRAGLAEPVVRGAPDGVVRLRPDACFDVAVEGF
jgi:hypothetical protein